MSIPKKSITGGQSPVKDPNQTKGGNLLDLTYNLIQVWCCRNNSLHQPSQDSTHMDHRLHLNSRNPNT